jgi:chlorobactene glucosyltransferase
LIIVLLYMALAILTVFAVISIYNGITAPMLKRLPKNAPNLQTRSPVLLPRVSVLVPVQNDEARINHCLDTLLQQTYTNLEIIVLIDRSTDRTAEIVQGYTERHTNVKFLQGMTLPAGWTEKNWACQQLSAAANGDVLIFTEAFTTYSPQAVYNTVSWLMAYQFGMITAFPQQRVHLLGEQLIVPLIDLMIYAGLPLWLTYKADHPSLTTATGQWIAFNKDAYTLIGGHVSVRDRIVEDIELARTVKQRGIAMLTMAGTKTIFSNLYESFDVVWQQFTKNIFGLVRYNTSSFIALSVMLTIVCILPYCTVWFQDFRILSLAAIALNVLIRSLLALKFKHPLLASIILHPVGITMLLFVGFKSYKQVEHKSV